MKLRALDTIRVSAAEPKRPVAGEAFEVPDDQGKILVERGLAIEVKPGAKAKAGAPANKARKAAPANKAKRKAN